MKIKCIIFGSLVGVFFSINTICKECFEYIDKVPHTEIRPLDDFGGQRYISSITTSTGTISFGTTASVGNITINFNYLNQN